MNTNYDNEETLYQGVNSNATRYSGASSSNTGNNNTASGDNAKPKKGSWKRTAAGAGTGLVIGIVASALMGMKKAEDATEETGNNGHNEEGSSHEWVDDQVPVATSETTDLNDMTFGEAFAAARAEVGPGGCFEWHGQIYSTYTSEEWNNMTPEQRAEYSNHFNWNHIDHNSSDVALQTNPNPQSAAASNSDDIDVISVNHDEPNLVENGNTVQDESEIEILGVTQDDSTGAYYGGIAVDGQDVVVVDVDGDMVFDYMLADVNGNGQIEQEEVADIHSQGLTVSDLNAMANPSDDLLASNDTPDYSSDSVYEG